MIYRIIVNSENAGSYYYGTNCFITDGFEYVSGPGGDTIGITFDYSGRNLIIPLCRIMYIEQSTK